MLTDFEPARQGTPAARAAAQLRFGTLYVNKTSDSMGMGGMGYVCRATNTYGETVGLKRIRSSWTDIPPDKVQMMRQSNAEALRVEYRSQCAMASLRGFPEPYGIGVVDGLPAIVMEWVEGVTLQQATKTLPHYHDATGHDLGCTGEVVRNVGISVSRVLVAARSQSPGFIHRDISARNIMLRTSSRTVAQQAVTGDFDICLIDFGSTLVPKSIDFNFTTLLGIGRGGTPEYAPPEMLTLDIPNINRIRQNPAIDVYALSSVLYELYCGHTPYRLHERKHLIHSIYRTKTDERPYPLQPHTKEDHNLVEAIMSGINKDQNARPTIEELLARLEGTWDKRSAISSTRKSQPEGRLAPAVGLNTTTKQYQHVGPRRQVVILPSPQPLPLEKPPRQHSGLTIALVLGAILCICILGNIIRTKGLLNGLQSTTTSTETVATQESDTDTDDTDTDITVRANIEAYSWAELRQIADAIANADNDSDASEIADEYNIALGDTKTFELSDGTEVTAQIVGMRHDTKSDGSYTGISFISQNCVATSPMCTTSTNLGGWEYSYLREWMNDTLYNELPDELATEIVAVSKLTNNTGEATSTTCVTSTTDMLWVPSYAEIVGPATRTLFIDNINNGADLYDEGESFYKILSSEGTQYQYYSDYGTEGGIDWFHAYMVLNKKYNGSYVWWWTRTPRADADDSFQAIYLSDTTSNELSGSDATKDYGVALGFCL